MRDGGQKPMMLVYYNKIVEILKKKKIEDPAHPFK
jgi:hypothetical protein